MASLIWNLQPSSPARQAGTGVISNSIETESIDAAVAGALVDIGRADLVLKPVRTLALEDFARILADAAISAFFFVTEDAAFHRNVVTWFDDETLRSCWVHLNKENKF